MVPNEPLAFASIYRSYIWGGTRLKTFLKKSVPSEGCWAESWEIVDRGQDQTRVAEGLWKGWSLRELIEAHPESIIGRDATARTHFPLLLKYLDCQRVLSVQVHPDDAFAKRLSPPDLGKTEAWYVIDAAEDALLYAGLKDGVGRSDLVDAMQGGRTEECLHAFHPKKGDCVFIPAGTVHALGAGLIVAEIQQSSDTTFRLFDWDRVGDDGRPRPLHIDQALEVIDFEIGPIGAVRPRPIGGTGQRLLVDCDKFRLIEVNASTELGAKRQFQVVTVVQGSAGLVWSHGTRALSLGQSVLVPAACENLFLQLGSDAIVLIATGPTLHARTDP